MRKRTVSCSWILPRLWSRRSTSSQSACGVTMRQLARLSSVVPHKTAFLPPAFIAILPPMVDASLRGGVNCERQAVCRASSDTRLVTTPAPVRTVATLCPTPGSSTCSTPDSCQSSFSVLITAQCASSGTGGARVAGAAATRDQGQTAVDACLDDAAGFVLAVREITTNGISTRQSVASVACDTRARPLKSMLSLR